MPNPSDRKPITHADVLAFHAHEQPVMLRDAAGLSFQGQDLSEIHFINCDLTRLRFYRCCAGGRSDRFLHADIGNIQRL